MENKNLMEKRTELVKRWDAAKDHLRAKRELGEGLSAAEWIEWDAIDEFYGAKVAAVELEIWNAGGQV